MGTNKAENSIDKKLVNTISKLVRDMREIKTKQPVGSDSLLITENPGAGLILSAGPITLAPGGATFVVTTLAPLLPGQTLSNFVNTLYIDAFDTAHAYPSGSSITTTVRTSVYFTAWLDSLKMRQFVPDGAFIQYMGVFNKDTVSHNIWVEIRAFTPQSAGVFS